MRRAPAHRARAQGAGARDRERRPPLRRDDRPRRHRRRERARQPGAGRGGRRQAAVRPDRRPVHGQEADRVEPRARRARPRRLAPGLRRGRARVFARGDGARRRRHRRPPRPRPAARGGDGALGDHDLGEPGADGRGRQPRAAGRRRGGLRPLGAGACPDRRGDRDRGAPRLLRRRARRSDPRRASDRRGASVRRAQAAATSGRARPGSGRAADEGRPARAARLAEPPQPRLGLPPLRPARRLAHGSPAGPRRRRSPPAPLVPRARGQPRRLGADRPARPAHRRSDGRDRSGAQRRLRRRRAARDHRLPQLREPREAGDRLGARRGDRGHVRGLRGARDPGRVRQRLALQRHGRPLDPPHAGRRLRRSRRRRARRAGRLARGRRDLPRRRAGALVRRLRVPGACTASSAGRPAGSTSRARRS